MTNDDVPNDLATVEQPGDVRYHIPIEHRCTCGYDLRGLTLTARCPECGKRIDETIRGSNRSLREIRGGGLSGPASAVFLIFLAHVLWLWTALSIPTSWGETWLHRWLVAIAGPNLPLGVVISATPRYAFNDCMTIVVCFALQLAGVWLLANVRAYPRQIAATAIAWVLQVALAVSVVLTTVARTRVEEQGDADAVFVVGTNVYHAVVGAAWGAFFWRFGLALHARGLMDCGRILIILLPLASLITIACTLYDLHSASPLAATLMELSTGLTAVGGAAYLITLVVLSRALAAAPIHP
jgi:hypothetical protein